ncbi:MAG TPA: hypothetical protein VH024_17390 [Candidatus Angelobacter sp.]|jgi:hypothetical protein|nr:hypothetical protein [Candidatus Angelobacter sp.]
MINRILLSVLIVGLWFQASAQNFPSRQVVIQKPGDADYTIPVKTSNIWTTALTANRTWTLPAANTSVGGDTVTITDMGGAVSSPGNNITVAAAGSDTINGASNLTLMQPYSSVTFTSNGTNGWAASSVAASTLPAAANLAPISPYGVVQGPLTLLKFTPSIAAAPGAGLVTLYAEKGSTSGTCKIVAVAGTSGTEAVIIDNIGAAC